MALWHPIDPSRPRAALAQLPDLGPRTVVWLNEAQFYLGPANGTGERAAAGLRELLREQDRGPVLGQIMTGGLPSPARLMWSR